MPTWPCVTTMHCGLVPASALPHAAVQGRVGRGGEVVALQEAWEERCPVGEEEMGIRLER